MRIKEVLREYNVPIAPEGHEHVREGWIQVDCPFCSPNWKHFRMGYNERSGYFSCWACGGHRTGDTLALLTGLSWQECKELIGRLDKTSHREKELEKKGKYIEPAKVGPLLKAHARYLRERGFNPKQLVNTWGIGGIGIAARLKWRIFIPVFYKGVKVSWTTRSIAQSPPVRYLSASAQEESTPHRRILYGEDFCQHAIIVHEGPFDVWRTGPGATCTFGTGFTQHQVRRIALYPTRAICYDNVPDAQKRARELCSLLECFPGQTLNVVLSGKDAAEAPETEIRQLRREILGHR